MGISLVLELFGQKRTESLGGQLRKKREPCVNLYSQFTLGFINRTHRFIIWFFNHTISFFREQGMEHFDSDRIRQLSPAYLDLRVDLMLYCVLHWTFHSFYCVIGLAWWMQ